MTKATTAQALRAGDQGSSAQEADTHRAAEKPVVGDQEPTSAFDYELAMERYRKRMEEIQTVAGRRYHACRHMSEMRDLIDALPTSQQREELRNMANLLLRMVLIENDGGPLSPSQLNGF